MAGLSATRRRGANLTISPASLAAVISLIDLGANTPLHASFCRSLGFEGNGGDALLESLRQVISGILNDNRGRVLLANGLIIDPRINPVESTIAKMQSTGAEITIGDVTDPAVMKRINDWVSTRTKGRIPAILDAPPEKGAVALNAIYFKDDWESPFDKGATKPRRFYSLDRETEVSMMRQATVCSFRREGRFVAVDLPYVHRRYSFAVITTVDRPAAADEFADVAHWLDGNAFSAGPVRLLLPSFTATEQADLLDPLKTKDLANDLASPSAFEGLAAFPVTMTSILQRLFLKVSEQGTEAAAATGVMIAGRSMHIEENEIVIDKPFLFALRDSETGLILMSGYIGTPKSEAII